MKANVTLLRRTASTALVQENILWLVPDQFVVDWWLCCGTRTQERVPAHAVTLNQSIGTGHCAKHRIGRASRLARENKECSLRETQPCVHSYPQGRSQHDALLLLACSANVLL
eukprot:1140850-Pelagomonas_calceolata.AAC.8